MNIIKIELPLNKSQYCENLVLGHFNVIHYGHLKLFNNLNDFSVMIFENNPSKLHNLYNLEERINNFKRFNPKNVYVYDILKFNLNANLFIEEVLKNLNFKNLIVGSDFVFGKNKQGKIDDLKKVFNVKVVDKQIDTEYSTTKISQHILNGEIELVNKLLVNNFYYQNEVIHGKGLAKKMFKPTANILNNKKNIDLKSGSYASITEIDNKFYKSISFIGIPKSFEDIHSYVETHIYNFDKDLYGKKIKVFPLKFIRENQKFNDIEILKKAIVKDFEDAQVFLDNFDMKLFKP